MTTQENTQASMVWDLFIRFFHWTLVAAFIVSYLTEGEYNLHFYTGWYIAILLTLRIIWGLIGTKYARFSDFVKPPSDIIQYVKFLMASEDDGKTYLGHNPLGGLMVIIMLGSLATTTFTGVLLYKTEGNDTFAFLQQPILQEIDEEDDHEESEHGEYNEHREDNEHKNPATKYNEDEHEESELGEALEELHEFFANLTLLLILFHVAGVFFTSRHENRNLVKAMLTGKK